MQRLLNPDLVPPEPHFAYRNPQSGHWSVSQTHDDWIKQEYEHRKGNGMDVPPNLRQIMEEQLCSTLPAGWCEEFDPNRIEPLTRMHRGDVLEGMKVFAKWAVQKAPYVSQVEAERRADICSRCHLNVQVLGCSSCHAIADELTKKVSTSKDGNLIACAVCKCLLRAKVWFPLPILETVDNEWKQKTYPKFCWLKKGGENYVA